jgi:hypothetical protein
MNFEPCKMQGYLTGPEVEAIMFEAGYLAQALYESSAPKNTGRLAASSVVDVEIARPYPMGDPRWVATLSVESPYGVPVFFGHMTNPPVPKPPRRRKPARRIAPNRALRRVVEAVKI